MKNFWVSGLGDLTGSEEDSFTSSFVLIPDNTTAIGVIERFTKEEYNEHFYYEIRWKLTTGDFKNRNVFQKIHAFDADNKKRHKALNILLRLYRLHNIKPPESEPSDLELIAFIGKHSGLKIQEWHNDDKHGNWVSEIHPTENFKTETGLSTFIPSKQDNKRSAVESAFSSYEEYKKSNPDSLNDDCSF